MLRNVLTQIKIPPQTTNTNVLNLRDLQARVQTSLCSLQILYLQHSKTLEEKAPKRKKEQEQRLRLRKLQMN